MSARLPAGPPAPATAADPQAREAAGLFAQAADFHRRGQLGQATREYSRAILLNPRHADAYNNLGVALR
ncbi:MAG: tetratricopeptide repeat protein, partial [Pseudomonadota bacterium]